MPAFTFEKITPPVPRGPSAPAEEKQRGRVGQLLDRFTDARTKRALRKEGSAAERRQEPSG